MNKEIIRKYIDRLKQMWQEGRLQKNFRITYDVLWNIILFFIILGIIGLFFAGGAGAGYFASLVKDMPVRSYESMEKDIYNYQETSELYFSDNEYMGTVNSDLYREEVTLDKVSEHVKNALIATEDVYFESHNGVVPKAIFRAVYQEATNAVIKTGGSTLTQQLIKNQILTNEVSFERKAKEILLAMRLEKTFSKEQILEAYLNVVPFGRNAAGNNIAGVQTAARGIFGVDAKDLNIAQSAFIAGLPQSPSYYTPFTNSGEQKTEEGLQPGLNRMKTVLNRMLEAGYITQSEYTEAMDYDIVADLAEPMPSTFEKYPRLTDEVQSRVVEFLSLKLATDDGYTEEDFAGSKPLQEEYSTLAVRALRSNGYKIHTTINKEIYEKWQEIAANYDNYGPDKPETIIDENGEEKVIMQPVQAAGMLIENKTGKIISFAGGRNDGDFQANQNNYATDTERNNGSTMKPLLVYAPAMEAGIIQPGSVILDAPLMEKYPALKNAGEGGWLPQNYTGNYYGLVSIREALKKSHNTPAAKVYAEIIGGDPVTNYLEKMGFTSLSDDPNNNDYTNLAMSIGSMARGVTVEENVNAYTTFANDGKFADAYMIEKIETHDGEVIYEHETEEVEIFTPQTAYLALDMMRDVVSSGTASSVRSLLNNPDVDWAGKTGTTNDWHDHWFVASNPNVTMGTWVGYDTPKSLRCNSQYPCSTSYSQRNLGLWAELVNAATEIDPDLAAPENNFKEPEGIVERSYCATSGMKPSDLCESIDLVRSDIYNEQYTPTKTDDSLIRGNFVEVDGQSVAAGENTPEEFTSGNGVSFNPEWLKRMMYNKLDDLSMLYPRNRNGGWNRVAIPSTLSTTEMENDGEQPARPENLEADDNTLSWDGSESSDVMGYRIYRASRPGESFALIGNTSETDYQIPGNGAVYYVKAVDYFGEESEASNSVQVGTVAEPEAENDSESTVDNNEQSANNQETETNVSEEDNEAQTDDSTDTDNNDNQETAESEEQGSTNTNTEEAA